MLLRSSKYLMDSPTQTSISISQLLGAELHVRIFVLLLQSGSSGQVWTRGFAGGAVGNAGDYSACALGWRWVGRKVGRVIYTTALPRRSGTSGRLNLASQAVAIHLARAPAGMSIPVRVPSCILVVF